MPRLIRAGVFETNSSSCHSLTIKEHSEATNGVSRVWDQVLTYLINGSTPELSEDMEICQNIESWKVRNLLISLTGGEYGWQYINMYDPIEKLNYVLTNFYVRSGLTAEQFLQSEWYNRFVNLFDKYTYFSFSGYVDYNRNRLIPTYTTIDLEFKFVVNVGDLANSYIDHESVGLLSDLSDEELIELVFDPRNCITTDGNG